MSEIGMEAAWKSEGIAKLSDALAKAQAEVTGAAKDSENPHFKSKYADLASIWDACRVALSKNGLAVVQLAESDGDKATVVTLLTHSSGEWIKGRITLKPVKADAQGIGSALTYGRRYGLAAMVGVAPEDDDGNAASREQPGKAPPVRAVAAKPTTNGSHDATFHRDRMKGAARKWSGVPVEDVRGVCLAVAKKIGATIGADPGPGDAKVADAIEGYMRDGIGFPLN